MVFFVCEACNETLKKNQVDKHCFSCRRCEAVTCVDCQVTFYGDDYKEHMVCVSEAEKYEKSLFKGKKEKADPQAAWMDLIASCAAKKDGSQHVQRILARIADTPNVPRNKKKFGNFIKNSMKIYADGPIDETWNYLEKAKNCHTEAQPAAEVTAKNSHTEAQPAAEVTAKNSHTEAQPAAEVTTQSLVKKRKVEETEDTCGQEDQESKKEKKKKKRKRKEFEHQVETQCRIEVKSDDQSLIKKKIKDKKEENNQEDEEISSEIAKKAEKTKKKKKKRKDTK